MSAGAAIPAPQVAALRATGIRIAAAGYLPAGFRFARVTTRACANKKPHCIEGPTYTIRYERNASAWLEVDGTGGGIGSGGTLDYRTAVHSPLLGTVPLNFGFAGRGDAKPPIPALMQKPALELYSDFVPSGDDKYQIAAGGITAAEAQKVLAALVWLPASQPSTNAPSSTTAAIPRAQAVALRAVGIPIAIPADVPAGFRFVRVTTQPCPKGSSSGSTACKFGPDYTIRYGKSPVSWFQIEGTGGGIGGVDDDYRTTVHTSLFGTVALNFGTGRVGDAKAPTPALMQTVQPHLLSDWGSVGGKGPFYHLEGASMTPADAAKVLSSLTWLR
ncbi:MAG: hypothetical protein JOZ24_10650 [Candidatus Eremiobacteraeota bacterium]|nr:hypothetical protein [Candidatus Eremiobacteraeota bacterium]